MNKLLTVTSHSLIDVITNSSSEIFCTVKAKSKEFLEKVVKQVVAEFDCTAVNLYVDICYEKDEYYNDTEVEKSGVFEVWYDYECGHEPCTSMKKRLMEVLGVSD